MTLLFRIGFWQFLAVTVFLIVSGIEPRDRFTWVLEISWVAVGLILVGWYASRGGEITGLLAWGLTIHAVLLIYGGWYTYEHVPLGEWLRELFAFERNHYDRLGHFAQGFFPALLAREVLYRNRVVNGRYWLELVVLAFCMAFTGIFEIIEFAAAVAFGAASEAYLGSQGDVWDAQWDMFFCGVGGLSSIALLSRWHMEELRRLANGRSDR